MGQQENQLKILVTGGGGFIGSALVKRLLDKGHQISSLSRKKYPHLEALNVKTIQADLVDRKAIFQAVNGHEIVIHTAALAGYWGSAKEYYRSNVLGTVNIIDACKKFKIQKLLYTSSASVVFSGENIINGSPDLSYPDKALNHYSHTKAIAEQLILAANFSLMKTISLRPHIVLGPGDNHILPRLIQRAKSGKLKVIGDGQNQIDFVYIDNLVDAHMDALKAMDQNPSSLGKAYFITNEEPVNLWNFVNQILTGIGLPVVSGRMSSRMALAVANFLCVFNKLFKPNQEPILTPFLVKELSQSHWFDPLPAKRELGYTPSLNSEQTLDLLIEYLKV